MNSFLQNIFQQIKYYIKSIIFFTLVFILNYNGFSQVPTDPYSEDNINQKIEDITENLNNTENSDEELDYTDLISELDFLKTNPLNINTANKEDLKQLYFLNDIQIHNLIEYIQKNGQLVSIYELQYVDGFDIKTINKIRAYIDISETLKPHVTLPKMIKYGKNNLMIRYQQILEEQKGFTANDDTSASPNSRYLGSPEKIYARYQFKYSNKLSFGITAEKDAGEEFFNGTQKNGFDFYSAHLFFKDFGKIKALAIGDYQVQFGQGLTLWSGLSFSGKSYDIMNIKKNAQGIKKYSSTDENNFLRGIGTTVGIKNFDLSVFYSNKKIDASKIVSDTLDQEDFYISSIQETGLHGKQSEVDSKDALGETIYGAHLKYNNNRLTLGATAFNLKYDTPLNKNLSLYNQFDFNAQENTSIGLNYSYFLKNTNIFGEVSRSENGGTAFLNGALLNLNSRVSFSILHRRYEKDFQPLLSSALGENSKNANEQGLFLGILLDISSKWSLSAYSDNIMFPWMRYRVNAPSDGNDYLLQVNYNPSSATEMYFRFKQKNKYLNNTDEENIIDYIEQTVKQNFRYHIYYRVSNSFKLKNQIEYISYKVGNNKTRHGYLIFQDVSYKSDKIPVSLSARYALFDTDTYDERIYAYESDVLYAFSIPAYYYKGSRIYLLIKYKISKNINLGIRFARTYYNNKNVISSGLTEIQGNTKSEIKAQIRMKF